MAVAVALCASTTSFAQNVAQPDAYGEPTKEYLLQFKADVGRVFVYERFDVKGVLVQRDAKSLSGPVLIKTATERSINGVGYRLRGLRACPTAIVTYEAEKWDCEKAADDYATAVYNRASVVLCKTLVLKSEAGQRDPVSCFALLGAGNAVEPYTVYNDDDAMVFLGLADIGRNNAGKSLRPDLERSESLGENYR
jgi:hypothetical protein